MSTPKTIVWERDEGTAAKHDLLQRYLSAWLPILMSRHPRVAYVEGFAGPGVYTKGEPGSPVIALQVIAKHRATIVSGTNALEVVLVEEHQGRHARLVEELTQANQKLGTPPSNVRVHPPIHGDCAKVLPTEMTQRQLWGIPMLVVLDSWGGPDVPFELLQRVAQNKSGEVLVTFGTAFLTRFGEHGEEHAAAGDLAFGDQSWRAVFGQPSDGKGHFLVQQYRSSLSRAGFAHVLSFEMVDRRGQQLWLMFGTNNRKGVEKMKDAMWKVDPAHGVRYRDPLDPDQLTLDITAEPATHLLQRQLYELLQKGPQTLEQLRNFAEVETVYRQQHVLGAVRQMLKEGRLARQGNGHLSGDTVLELGRPNSRDAEAQMTLDF